MGLRNWLKSLWKKEEDTDLEKKVMMLDISRQGHAQVIADCLERADQTDNFKHIVANAVSKQDDRLEHLEKMAGFLYEKLQEVDGKVSDLHDRTTATEFHVMKHDASVKSTEN